MQFGIEHLNLLNILRQIVDVPFDGFFSDGSYLHISAQKIWLCTSFMGEFILGLMQDYVKGNSI